MTTRSQNRYDDRSHITEPRDFTMGFACGCTIVNHAKSNYKEYTRFVCPHHQFHEVLETELSQRSINFDVLAGALGRGPVVMNEARH